MFISVSAIFLLYLQTMNTEKLTTQLIIRNNQLEDENHDLQQRVAHAESVKLKLQAEHDEENARMKAEYEGLLKEYERKYGKIISDLRAANLEDRKDLEREKKENEELKAQLKTTEADRDKAQTNLSIALCDVYAASASATKEKSSNGWLKRQLFAPTTEQMRMLCNRSTSNRQKEKAQFMGLVEDEEIVEAGEVPTSDKPKKTYTKTSVRTDYAKNKPYTANPVYVPYSQNYTLKEGEHYKKRDGKVEVRLHRIVVRVPEHYEERFIEIATVRGKGGLEKDSVVIEDKAVPGVPFDAEMIGYILVEHYHFNTTWGNLVKKLEYHGLKIPESTLVDIAHRCIAYLKEKMGETWVAELKKAGYWMIDETCAVVGDIDKETGKRKYKKEYLWGIRANIMKLAWFIYDEGSRGTAVIKPYLDAFKGFFTTDGYVVYKLFDDMEHPDQTHCSCLTHIRRLFINALNEHRSLAKWFINKIAVLFSNDKKCAEKGLTGEQRMAYRLKHSQKIVHEIEDKFKAINKEKRTYGTLMTAALRYITNEWGTFKNVLKNGDVELSNNLAEQMMRHIKTNLKNSENIGSQDCAQTFSFMYSLTESCSMNGLSPMRYIKMLIEKLKDENVDKRTLLPCNYKEVA